MAFIDAFRSHGIYPRGLRSLSDQSLAWDVLTDEELGHHQLGEVTSHLRNFFVSLTFENDRQKRWECAYESRRALWSLLNGFLLPGRHATSPVEPFEQLTGLDFSYEKPAELRHRRLHVYTLAAVQRVDENGRTRNLAVVTLLQRRRHYAEGEPHTRGHGLDVWGGCTMVFDLDENRLRYAIRKSVRADAPRVRAAVRKNAGGPFAFSGHGEPFAMLHRAAGRTT